MLVPAHKVETQEATLKPSFVIVRLKRGFAREELMGLM